MTDFPTRIEFTDVLGHHRASLLDYFRRSTIDVLVVVDAPWIDIAEGSGIGFGVGRFIRLLRESTIGCSRFNVDVAARTTDPFADNGPVPAGQARYVGYRFDSSVGAELVLDRYDEVFLFGFNPGNTNGPDSEITAHALAATNSELSRLTTWMNGGGGLFATGDHDFLGASMCHRIPRIGTMRRWTNAQGVPPQFSPSRLDTNQPVTLSQRLGSAVIPVTAEEDATPQRISWVPERVFNIGWLVRATSPHELLCHPTLGPIDVMPDHPHEGMCIERADIDPNAKLDFGGDYILEYPTAPDGHQELPKVIAYGNVVPSPPHQHGKGPVNPFRIPMISAYDGHRVGVGRVVTDSTWHHWFDMNILAIEAAANDENWRKISRYFLNVATWIARPGTYRSLCWWEILGTHFDYPGVEEYRPGAHWIELGSALYDRLARVHGPCTVLELVLVSIGLIHPPLREFLEERAVPKWPKPDPCLSCPPFDVIERAVLGGFVEGTRPIAERLAALIESGETKGFTIEAAEIEEAAMRGAADALADLAGMVARSASDTVDVFGALAGSSGSQTSV